MSELVWADMVRQNRNIYIVGSVVLIFVGDIEFAEKGGVYEVIGVSVTVSNPLYLNQS